MGPKRKAIDPPDGFRRIIFQSVWQVDSMGKSQILGGGPTARLRQKLWSAKGPFFFFTGNFCSEWVGFGGKSSPETSRNIRKPFFFFYQTWWVFLQMFHDFPFFSKPWFQASADPPEAFPRWESQSVKWFQMTIKINPFYGNLESMDLKWLEYVGVYRWQPPTNVGSWLTSWPRFDASSRLWPSIIFNSCGPCLRLGLHHSIKDNYMW